MGWRPTQPGILSGRILLRTNHLLFGQLFERFQKGVGRMSDAIDSIANKHQELANRPDLLELLKATATSKAEVNTATARLESEVAALRALPRTKPIATAA